MRIIQEIEEKRDTWKQDLRRSLLRFRNKYFSDEQLEPGHTYRDLITGELFTIDSIARQVSIRRHDADGNKQSSAIKEDVQIALELELIEHDMRHCDRCPNPRRLNDV